ncbi:hypothetical protein [Actinophytocola oryzae]|uniref:hypothetical protein n=1 Tax=Actinophytocola oryzae TaxID=502181 RepID=UPI0014150D31|nr:hypothetical protein [Actinophytocola oryzae]
MTGLTSTASGVATMWAGPWQITALLDASGPFFTRCSPTAATARPSWRPRT